MHVSNILAKLGLSTRAEIAAWAVRHKLTRNVRDSRLLAAARLILAQSGQDSLRHALSAYVECSVRVPLPWLQLPPRVPPSVTGSLGGAVGSTLRSGRWVSWWR